MHSPIEYIMIYNGYDKTIQIIRHSDKYLVREGGKPLLFVKENFCLFLY